MTTPGSVVVWEWLFHSTHWLPYEPLVSNYVETAYSQWLVRGGAKAWPNQSSVCLRNVCSSLGLFVVELNTMSQTNQSTGLCRPVRRQEYPPDSPPGVGVRWQWEGDIAGTWHPYGTEVASLLEKAHRCSASVVDLNRHPYNLPYTIRLSSMLQIRNGTNYKRRIQRVSLPQPYMPTSSNFSHTAAVSPFAVPVFQPANATAHSSLGLIGGGIPGTSPVGPGTSHSSLGLIGGRFPGTSPVDVGSLCFSPLFANSLPSGFLPSSNSSSGPAVGSLWGSGTHGGSSAGADVGLYPCVSSCSVVAGHKPLFTIGQSQPSGSTTKRRRVLVRDLTPTTRSQTSMSQPVMTSQTSMSQPVMSSQPPPYGLVGLWPSHNGAGMSGVTSGIQASLDMSSKRKRDAQQVNVLPASQWQASNTATATAAASFLGFPGAGQSVSGIHPGFSTTAAQMDSRKSHKSRRLRPPTSAINVVHQEDVKDVAGLPAKQVLQDFVQLVTQPPATEDCCICCDSLKEASGYGGSDEHVVVQLYKCSHMFHLDCLVAMYDSGTRDGGLQCPTCKSIYGVKRGDCPDGTMSYHAIGNQLPGFDGCGAIEIIYNITGGYRNGKHYACRGFPRYAYLPNNDRGRLVLELLAEAWRRRLTFTIGTSVTTGEPDTVVWNEIHHKTSIGNDRGHGYPDPNYLDNVIAELAAQGVEDN